MSQLFLCAVWRGGSSTAPSKDTFFAFSRRFSCFLSYDNEPACLKLSAHLLTSSNTGFHPRTIRTDMIHEAGLLVKCTDAFDEHLTELKLAHNFYFGIFEAKPVKTIARYINFRWNKCPGHRWEKCLLLYSTMFGSIGLAVGLLASAAWAKILYAGVNEVRFDTQARFPECAFMNSSPPQSLAENLVSILRRRPRGLACRESLELLMLSSTRYGIPSKKGENRYVYQCNLYQSTVDIFVDQEKINFFRVTFLMVC